jgi:hypothetical protein
MNLDSSIDHLQSHLRDRELGVSFPDRLMMSSSVTLAIPISLIAALAP